ncbi:MAG: hypothetical protein IJ685_00175 [Selenomonadaceae bacterium]|nr:hypothetical protein [Selenomonadaceae bacterium]
MNYKLNEEITSCTVTQTNLGRALGLSQQRINQLIDEGIVIRDDFDKAGRVMLYDSLQNFFLSKNATLGEGSNNVNFWKEKGLHEKAKRELAEVKLAKTRGELYEASAVEGVLSEILTNFRSKLLGLPAKYAAQLEGKSRAKIYQLLNSAVEENLIELAAGLEGATFETNQDVEEDFGESRPTDT